MTQSLWTDLRALFEEDDGTLPEIRITYVKRDAVVAGYAMLREVPGTAINDGAGFWCKLRHEERPLDSVPNAAALVVAGDAEPFHVVLRGMQLEGTTMPDLGVYVFPGQLALDYRKGTGWNAEVLGALFLLLADLSALDEAASLGLDDHAPAEDEQKFQRAWIMFQSERSD
ncbi:MAG: hypothetical protein JJ900_16840 [Rhodospirillales bacterium]|nr:hypothetical protein [Rhodospirillales bacterium]MBO6788516.1 hypothetical protein [Rhodospirillales bacterium]